MLTAHRKKLSQVRLGKKAGAETKQKMRDAHKEVSLETCKKLSLAGLGRKPWNKGLNGFFKHTEAHKKWIAEKIAKSYIITTPDGVQQIVRNLSKYCRENNLLVSKMVAVANGTRNHHKGYNASMTKICCLSDLHGYLPQVPTCDICIIAGDLCPVWNHNIYFQGNWLNYDFHEWLETVPAKHKVVIAGNHDWVFEKNPGLVHKTTLYHYLQDSSVEIEGFKVWGTPHQPRFFDWAFNLDEPDLVKKWSLIPDDTDIIVVHGPPHGCGDIAPRDEPPGYEHTGSPGLAEKIKAIKPKLVVAGHIHEGYGTYDLAGTIVANASVVNGKYQLVHEPLVYELTKN